MRPALTMTLLAATLLAVQPGYIGAQTTGGNASSDDVENDAQSSGVKLNVAPLSETEKAEARRLARLEKAKEEERMRQERARLCVIKPVMTDTEIAQCKEVWR